MPVTRKKGGKDLLLEKITAVYAACMLSVFLLYPGLGGYQNITA